jgi:hypothetical protein
MEMSATQTIMDIFYKPLFATDPTNSLMKAIEKNEKRILQLNKNQLDRGLDAEGQDLGVYANFNYKGRYRPIDLYLEGDFRGKFTLLVTDKYTELFSQDEKAPKIRKRWKNAVGIAPDDIERMIRIIQPDFVTIFKKTYLNGR